MTTKPLGNSDMHLTPLGVGAWAMGGGGWAFGWGAQDDQDSIRATRAALDRGMNWIDTAAIYGIGHSEVVTGQAIQGLAQKPYVFTKCSRLADAEGKPYGCLKAASVRKECEDSLRRLRVDAIDLYQIHWPLPEEDIEEGWTTMAELQAEGKARWIGVSNFSAAQMKRAQAIAPITSLQPPYSMISPESEAEILPHARATGVGVIVYSPMKNGLLSGRMTKERVASLDEGDWRRRNPAFQEPALSRNLELVELLREIGAGHGRTPGEVAIAWTLANEAVTAAIVGVRSAEQVEGVIGAMEFRLSAAELVRINEFRASRGF
jgi:aryl-alcohol dehydrogenase-like predicted oxidoreductase